MTKPSLAKSWCLVKFGDLAESITERVDDPKASGVEIYVGLEHLDSDTTKISRYGTPDDVESTKLRFYPGDVIYARRRAYQRKLGVAEVEGICSAHALVLRARPDVCLPEFLPYFLQSNQFHDRALSISVGSLSPTINWKTLVVQEFALPPIAEQRRIINLVSHLDNSVSCENASLTSLESLRLAIVKKATDEAVQAGQMKSFGQVADWFAGGTPRASERSFYDDGTIPWATIGDIFGRTISSTSSLITEDALNSIGGRLAPVGSILVSMYGTVGKAALVEKPMATNQAIAWAEPDNNQVIPEFLLAVIGLNEKKISELARGATQQNINRAILRSVEFGCPTLDSQIDAVKRLDSIEKVVFNVKKNLNNKRKLRSALLSNYQDVVSANV